MSLLSVNQLTFAYDGSYDNIFENVSFQLDTDWHLGFVGRNGRGKTTLLKLLMGEHEYRGSIGCTADFDYFPFPVDNTQLDTLQVLEQICPEAALWQIQKEFAGLELGEQLLYRPFETLSSGERTKALLSALFLRRNRFLLIDEPTNHLDMHAREVVGDYLAGKPGFILVSHDRTFLDRCIDHVLCLERDGITVQQGNFSSWWQNRQYRDQFELAENERLEREVAHLRTAAQRTSGWSDAVERTKYGGRNSGLRPDRGYIGHKSAKMMKRAKAAEQRRSRALEEKQSLLRNLETTEALKLSPLSHYSRCLVETDGLSVRYGEYTAFENLKFTVENGERVALCGRNGSGKSSVLKLVMGQDIPHTGTLRLASGLVLSYLPQDASFLSGSLSEFAEARGIDGTLFRAILRKLDFARVQFEKDMADYSGGQKKKVLIAASLCERAHLYVWDEPLNYVDLYSRMQLEELLDAYRPTMLFVEHDRAFVDAVATRQVQL